MIADSNFLKTYLGAVCATLILAACSKTESKQMEPPAPDPVDQKTDYHAAFSVQILNVDTGATIVSATNARIDSTFYFQNKSDSGAGYSYKWDFGDGSTSSEKNPLHKFAKRGKYLVVLRVNNESGKYDTSQQLLSVWLGQKVLGDTVSNRLEAVALTALNSGDFVTILRGGSDFKLYLLDSLLQVKSRTGLQSGVRMGFVSPSSDGNYVGVGASTTANFQFNEIMKINTAGQLLWAQTLSESDNVRSVYEVPDGGYLAVGTKYYLPPGAAGATEIYTILTKTNTLGTIQWQTHLFKEGFTNSNNAIIESNGVVVAGSVKGACTGCDSISIAKISHTGSVIWSNTVYGGTNNQTFGEVSVAKLANGSYAVSHVINRGIFMFSSTGTYINRYLAPYSVMAIQPSDDGNMIVLQAKYPGTPRSMFVSKVLMDGTVAWSTIPNSSFKDRGGQRVCCAITEEIGLVRMKNGGTLSLGAWITPSSANSPFQVFTTLFPLNDDGTFH